MAVVEKLSKAGAHFRNEIVTGVGGKQIIVDDPSGNPIELFQSLLLERVGARNRDRAYRTQSPE